MSSNLFYLSMAQRLYDALRHRTTIEPLTKMYPETSQEDAYHISRELLSLRLIKDKEHLVGKKIGVTSSPVQEMLNVYEPDFGFLTDAMQQPPGSKISIHEKLIQPRIEVEIAFVLKKKMTGPGVTVEDVLSSTRYICPCFEIVDSRIEDWKIKIQDTIADNASCGLFIMSDQLFDPEIIKSQPIEAKLFKSGELICTGNSSEVMGNPLASVAWLANTMGHYGVSLEAEDIILSGSMVPLLPVCSGDAFVAHFHGLGQAVELAVSFC